MDILVLWPVFQNAKKNLAIRHLHITHHYHHKPIISIRKLWRHLPFFHPLDHNEHNEDHLVLQILCRSPNVQVEASQSLFNQMHGRQERIIVLCKKGA